MPEGSSMVLDSFMQTPMLGTEMQVHAERTLSRGLAHADGGEVWLPADDGALALLFPGR